MATTGFVHHPTCAEHLTGPGHPERPARLQAVLAELQACGLDRELEQRTPQPVTLEAAAAVHDPAYLEEIAGICERGPALLDGGDTAVSPRSFEAARLATGGVLEACDEVLAGRWTNAFVCCRPPGHHAERDRAMGFCLINSVAVAAAHLRQRRGIERVAIVDWDVHHGNGTQHLFERDPAVHYTSLHQFPHYPGTGAAEERGLGEGEGATLNLPMAAGAGDAEYLDAFEESVLPALEAFAPQFVLVSAGFDAHALDPLSGTELSTGAFGEMTRRLREVAELPAQGRVVSVLEGGYSLEALGQSARAHIEALLA